MSMARVAAALVLWLACACFAPGQSTQGVISGRVYSRSTGELLSDAVVLSFRSPSPVGVTARTNAAGTYVLGFLSPGAYRLRVSKAGYQTQEVYGIELSVAARVTLDFPMQPALPSGGRADNDVARVPLAEGEAIVHYFSADFQSTQSEVVALARRSPDVPIPTLSSVIDREQMQGLPLANRDTYATLALQAAVTADNATARGLGLSVNGLRPSSSMFLLDGVENNDYVTTGPLSTLAPEMIQEYRLSLNHFSAEYGRAAGFIANAVTASGGNLIRGEAYAYGNHQVLNANPFQRNALNCGSQDGLCPRLPLTQARLGGGIGGPIRRDRLWFRASAERFRSRAGQDPVFTALPSLQRIRSSGKYPSNNLALSLLEQFPAPVSLDPAPGDQMWTGISLAAPARLAQTVGLARLDYQSGESRWMGRLVLSRVARPDFIYSPYPDFSSPLENNSLGVAASHSSRLGASLHHELRAGWRAGRFGWERARSKIPTLSSFDGVVLPGSPAAYELLQRDRNFELSETALAVLGRHLLTFGGGWLLRRPQGHLSYGRDALFEFQSLEEFLQDSPARLRAAVSRTSGGLALPEFARSYANHQWNLFAQDSIRLTGRLSLTLGARYESFGTLRLTGEPDAMLKPGAGASMPEVLAGAVLASGGARSRMAYRPDRNNAAGRLGVVYALRSEGKTTLRAGLGAFYDRLFDNLTQNTRNNDVELLGNSSLPARFSYLRPVSAALADIAGRPGSRREALRELLWVDQGLRSPYALNWFAGMQNRCTGALSLDLQAMGSLGRKLVSTDLVNRYGSRPDGGRYNPALGDISFRSNAGNSTFYALSAVARYRAPRAQTQVSYTLGHVIDNQSEPLLGDFFDFGAIAAANTRLRSGSAAFTRQFDSRIDRGSADFDQRHNLVIISMWDLPAPADVPLAGKLLRNSRLAVLAGLRSGFPFSVVQSEYETVPGREGMGDLVGKRARLAPGRTLFLQQWEPVSGGFRLLDHAAILPAAPGLEGVLGRNSHAGPGFWNVDVSFHRRISVTERLSAELRADIFNLFNHANLDSPESLVSSPGSFGIALRGRRGAGSLYPSLVPLDESPRRVVLVIKLHF